MYETNNLTNCNKSLKDNIFDSLKYDSRHDISLIRDFFQAVFLALMQKYDFNTVAFYQVKSLENSELFAEPISLETKNNKDISLEKFKAFNIPLNIRSIFTESFKNKKSFYGRDKKVYKPTDVDLKINKIFGTCNYALLAIKGTSGDVIGWFYLDYRNAKRPFVINNNDIRYITELINTKLHLISWYETRLRNERTNIINMFCDEVRNPLTSIGGFARLLMKKEKDNTLKKYLSIIAKEVERTEEIINVISDLTKAELKGNPFAVNVHSLIEEAVEDARRNGEKYTIHQNNKKIKMWVDPKYAKKAAISIAKKVFFDTGVLKVKISSDKSSVYVNFHHPELNNVRNDYNEFNPFNNKLNVLKETCLSLASTHKYASATGEFFYSPDDKKGTIFTLKFPIYKN